MNFIQKTSSIALIFYCTVSFADDSPSSIKNVNKIEYKLNPFLGIGIGKVSITPFIGIDITDYTSIKLSSTNGKYYKSSKNITSLGGEFENFEDLLINTFSFEYFFAKSDFYASLGFSFESGNQIIHKTYKNESIIGVGNNLNGNIEFKTHSKNLPLFLGIGYRTKNKGLNFYSEISLSYLGEPTTQYNYIMSSNGSQLNDSQRNSLTKKIKTASYAINDSYSESFYPNVSLGIAYSF